MNPLKQGPAIPHLGSGRGGVKGEVARLRQQALQGVLATLGRDLIWSNGDGDAKTWREVMDIVELAPFGTTIVPQTVPEGVGSMLLSPGTWDLRHGGFGGAYVATNGANVTVEDGAVLKNVHRLFSVNLYFQGGGLNPSPKLLNEGSPGAPRVLLCVFGGNIQNGSASPVIVIPTGDFWILGSVLGGGVTTGASPAIHVETGGILYTININSTTGPVVGDNTVTSADNTALMGFGHTGQFTGFPSNPGFLGTQLNIALTLNGGSGPTEARPAAVFGPVPTGTSYYDTTIDKPIVMNNASAWVDYAGNPV